MISQEQKKEMLKVLGTRHISKISKYLMDNKIFSRTGHPYHSVVVSEVFNGRKANPTIEKGIIQLVEEYPQMLQKEQDRRNEIIANAKKAIDEIT